MILSDAKPGDRIVTVDYDGNDKKKYTVGESVAGGRPPSGFVRCTDRFGCESFVPANTPCRMDHDAG